MKIIQSLQNSKKFWNGVKLGAVALGVSAIESCTSPKALASSKKKADQIGAVVQSPSVDSNSYSESDLAKYKEHAEYDTTAKARLVFDKAPTDGALVHALAAKNVYFASPDSLHIGSKNSGAPIDQSVVEKIQAAGYTKVTVGDKGLNIHLEPGQDIKAALKTLAAILSDSQVDVDPIFTGISHCVTFNDPVSSIANSGGQYTQQGLSDRDWVANSFVNPTTNDADSLANLESLISASTVANPNVVLYIVGGGYDKNNADFTGRVLSEFNYVTNTNVVSPSDHETSVASTATANRNNAYGLAGIGNVVTVDEDIGDGVTFLSTDLNEALDHIIADMQANPSRRVVVNLSLGLPFLASTQAKLQMIKTLSGINNAGSGNTASVVSFPANDPSTWATGAVLANDYNRGIWTLSNTGPEMDFVSDGANKFLMNVNGSIQQKNGTSYSTPDVSAAAAMVLRVDPTLPEAQVKNILIKTAKDLGAIGFDNTYGNGYVREYHAAMYMSIMSFTSSINASNNPNFTYDFTPSYFNNGVINKKMFYPNGQEVPSTTTGGVTTFHFQVNTNNGYVNGGSYKPKYQFEYNGCTHAYTSVDAHTVSNVATLPSTPVQPNVLNVKDQCQSNTLPARGKITNWNSTYTLEVKHDGVVIPVDPVDTSFLYFTPGDAVGVHTNNIKFTNAAGSSQKDTANNVNTALVPSLSQIAVSGGPTYCTGQSVTLSTTAANIGLTPTYTWMDGATVLGTTSTPSFPTTLGTAGTKNYTCSVSFAAGTGCYSATTAVSQVKTINVGQTATPTGDVSPNTAAICANTAQNINYTVAGENGVLYTYTKHLINPSGVDQNIGNMAAPGTYSTGALVTPGTWKTYVEATLTGGPNPCASSVYRSDTATITVNLNTAADATITGPAAVCENSSINYSILPNSNVPAGSTMNIMKQVGSGAWVQIGTATTTQPPVAITGSTAAGLPTTRIRGDIVVSAPGCVTNGISDTLTVAGEAIPAAPTAVPTQPTCAIPTGGITVAAGPAGTTYSFNNGVSYQTSNASGPLAPGNYQVKVKSPAGCESTATSVTINAAPTVPANPTNQVTQPDCIVSTGGILITNPVAGQEYSFNGGTTWTTATSSGPLAPGTYNVMTRNATCTSGMVPTTINAQPVTPAVPTISAPAGNVLSIASPVAGVTYQWQFSATQNGTYANVATGTSYTATQSGRYRAIAQGTACNSAPSSAQQMIITGVGNPNNPNNFDIRVYPNPVHNTLTIDSIPLTYKVSLVIYDAAGRTVMPARQLTQVNNRASVDIAHLPAGIYFIGIYDMKNNEYIKKGIKVIKQ